MSLCFEKVNRIALTLIGIILLTLFSSGHLAQALAGQWWALTLFAHSLLATILLILHSESSDDSLLVHQFIAWCSDLLPLPIPLQWEEKIISGYEDYAKKVPSRLVPGL